MLVVVAKDLHQLGQEAATPSDVLIHYRVVVQPIPLYRRRAGRGQDSARLMEERSRADQLRLALRPSQLLHQRLAEGSDAARVAVAGRVEGIHRAGDRDHDLGPTSAIAASSDWGSSM